MEYCNIIHNLHYHLFTSMFQLNLNTIELTFEQSL